jgi:Zn-dependent protease with chaperone function
VDLGVLLSLPVESVTIRVILATVACVALARLVLRGGVRTPGVRVATAVAPAVVLLVVVVSVSTQMRLPAVMFPVEEAGLLPIPVADGYQLFAPMAIPILVGMWAVVVAARLARRGLHVRGAALRARQAIVVGETPAAVQALADQVADRLAVPSPIVTVVKRCDGGAFVIGRRHPVIVLDGELVARLDEDELEGVLAHELAHVRRRDNIVAGLLGTVRDLAFFVPGIGWAVRQLHRERELAADQVAVSATGRPGALASGLLKVLEGNADHRAACASFAPHGSLVDRVQVLVDDRPPPSRTRRSLEFGAAAGVSAISVVVAMIVPTIMAGPEREREAVALVWSASVAGNSAEVAAGSDARAFDVYRRTSVEAGSERIGHSAPYEDHSVEYRRSTLRACGTDGATCPAPDSRVGLGMQPRPVIHVDQELTDLWEAVPVADGDPRSEGFRMFWLTVRD